MAQNIRWLRSEKGEMLFDIAVQFLPCRAVMIVGHGSPADAPQPFDPVRLWVVRWGVDQIQVVRKLRQQLANPLRSPWGVRAQVVGDDDRDAATGLRAGNGGPHLLTEDCGGASRGQTTIKPTVYPVDQTKAVDFGIDTRSHHQPLAAPPLTTPDARQGGVKSELDFILEIDIRAREDVQ